MELTALVKNIIVLSLICSATGDSESILKLELGHALPPQRKPSLRITGGKEAVRGSLPWMVAIFDKKGKQFCAGSLINEEYVLTASHCFASLSAADIARLVVHIGDHNLKTISDGRHETRRIKKALLHKGFDAKTYNNDIALLKLDTPVNYTTTIQPISLPREDSSIYEENLDGKFAVVAGWGRLTSGIFGLSVNTLRQVEIPIWNYSECKRIYGRFAPGRLGTGQLCAGDGKKNKDACIGDSGGPLIIPLGGTQVQIGIVSWGKGCGSFPGVYTDIRKFAKWFQHNVAKNIN